MYVVIVIGAIGSGKSSLTALFKEAGAIVVDLDAISKDLLSNDCNLTRKLAQHFGVDILNNDGSVNRAVLAQRAFLTDESCKALNDIEIPAIMEEAEKRIDKLAQSLAKPGLCVVEVQLPNLVPEFLQHADEVILVHEPEEQRVFRAVQRGMSEEDIRARMKQQPSEEELRTFADTIMDNSGSSEMLAKQFEDWLARHG